MTACGAHDGRRRPKGGHAETQNDEFERLLLLETDDCILWTRSIHSKGYGYVVLRPKRRVSVHAEALLRRTGGRPAGMIALHQPGIGCRRNCMNYRHLRWGTYVQNCEDQLIEGSIPRGSARPNSRLTEEIVRAIRSDQRPQRVIAAEYGVTQSTVSLAVKGKKWKHV